MGRRKCLFPLCDNQKELFLFPRDATRAEVWARAVGLLWPQKKTSGMYVCCKHFAPDNFVNQGQLESGFANRLILKEDAVPIPISKTVVVNQMQFSSKPLCREVGCQTEIFTKDATCQTDVYSPTKHVSTQYSWKPERRSKSIQTKQHVKHVSCSTTTSSTSFEEGPLAYSTPVKRCRRESTEDNTFYPEVTNHSIYNESTVVETPPHKMRKFIVYEENLIELFRKCPVCTRSCTTHLRTVGTLLCVDQVCTHCEHQKTWTSQPYVTNIPAGNIQLSAAVIFSGASFLLVEKFLQAFNIAGISHTTFVKHQRNLLLPTINWLWNVHQSTVTSEAINSGDTVLGGDMRADSPGHSAKYGTYTLMDLQKNRILDIQLIQSNVVGNSQRMEKEGLQRCLRQLEHRGVRVHTIVTDRHPAVMKFLKENRPDVVHKFDAWHMAKGVAKKIDQLAKTRTCREVGAWKKSIVNHLYWCGASSSAGREIVAKWKSVANHVQNIHEHDGEFPNCLHQPLVGDQARQWLKPSTAACEKLCDVILAPKLLRDLQNLSGDYQTSSLESFHSLLIRFVPKSVAFSYLGMLCRSQLAAMHYNENSERKQATTEAGQLRWHIQYPRYKKGECTVRPLKTSPTYGYVQRLMELLFDCVLEQPQQFQEKLKEVDVPDPLCTQFTRPEKWEAVALHTSRFKSMDYTE
ncbi:uncharacterized protein [Pseudorasbora parva]|uniref:uncharacterized protein n=1 Tax=Pseudorasbora parva TaxID=51549 RepID=UPI00351F5C6B